jgi:hypothetical protein
MLQVSQTLPTFTRAPSRETKYHLAMESYAPLPTSCGTRYTPTGLKSPLLIDI